MLRGLLRRLRTEKVAPEKGSQMGAGREGYCYLGGHRALALTHRGHEIVLDTRDIGLTPHIALHGTWECEVEAVLQQPLRPGQSVAAVGVNIGYHTLAMTAAVGPTGHVHAFEASPDVLCPCCAPPSP
jgi:hypothetical protein